MNNKQQSIRNEFPMLANSDWVYLDSGATTQKPQAVIDAMTDFYKTQYATVHRGVYRQSQLATDRCESVRQQIADFIGADSKDTIIFTKGTTESINLVAHSFGKSFIKKGQHILISELEHHANIIPWQIIAEEKEASLSIIPINDQGELELDKLDDLLNENVAIVAINHVSNALGTINPIKVIIDKAHRHNIPVLIDGAQAVQHTPVNVTELDADFYCFSGHKLYGPTGIGVLYGKKELLETMPVYQTGGDMVDKVTFEKTTYAPVPQKFEAGTPMIVETIGLGEAVSFITKIGFSHIESHEKALLTYATKQLQMIPELTIIGTAKEKAAVIAFVIDGCPAQDIGVLCDEQGVALRIGHHCAQPVLKHFNIPATIRVSLGIYNTTSDIDTLIKSLKKAISLIKG